MPSRKKKKPRNKVCLYYERGKYPVLIYTPVKGGEQVRRRLPECNLTGDAEIDEDRKVLAEKKRLDCTAKLIETRRLNHQMVDSTMTLFDAYDKIRVQHYPDARPHKNTLRHLGIHFGKQFLIGNLNTYSVEDFKDYLVQEATSPSGKRIKPSTAGTYLDCLKTVLSQAERKGLIPTNPSNKVKRPKFRPSETHPLSVEEIRLLEATEAPSDDVKRAFLISARTGLRKVDLRNLKWGDVRETEIIVRQQKTQKRVAIPISPKTLSYLGTRRGDSDHVFQLPSDQTIANHLEKWCKDAGLTHRHTFHDARHTFGSLLANEDVEVVQISADLPPCFGPGVMLGIKQHWTM